MLENLNKYKIILASKSPRRHELLSGLDIEFEIKLKDIPENYPETLEKALIPSYLSLKKASAFKNDLKNKELVITSDTIVIVDDRVLEKPKDRSEAIKMIKTLSGKTHEVITGVTLMSNEKEITFSDKTLVTFDKLDEHEICYYVDKYRPFDKAGSYGVQEWIGYIGIIKMVGSYYNVMGLPVHKLYKVLKKF